MFWTLALYQSGLNPFALTMGQCLKHQHLNLFTVAKLVINSVYKTKHLSRKYSFRWKLFKTTRATLTPRKCWQMHLFVGLTSNCLISKMIQQSFTCTSLLTFSRVGKKTTKIHHDFFHTQRLYTVNLYHKPLKNMYLLECIQPQKVKFKPPAPKKVQISKPQIFICNSLSLLNPSTPWLI